MRKTIVPLLAIAALALALCPASFAAPEGDTPAAGHETANPAAVDLVAAVSTIAVFLVLLVVLSKTAWKPILAGLKAREAGIRGQIEGAEKANADAKALLADYERKLAAATEEAREIVEEGRKDGEALRARIETEATAEAGRQRERALRDIEIAKDGALREIYARTAALATEVAGKILQQRLDPAAHQRLVDEAVASYESSRKKPGARA